MDERDDGKADVKADAKADAAKAHSKAGILLVLAVCSRGTQGSIVLRSHANLPSLAS
jgi:hypothetical protein